VIAAISPYIKGYMASQTPLKIIPETNPHMILARVRDGLPVAALDKLVSDTGLTALEVDHLIIPRKTLAHRRRLATLSPDQSDRLMRVQKLINRTAETFGGLDKAMQFLRAPKSRLGGASLMSLLDTDAGADVLLEWLTHIDHGIIA
jgi:putative toxin-antitoxin system antitoxin component (TIGR02293 family)